MNFIQSAPHLSNTYDQDHCLRDVLSRLLPREVLHSTQDHLKHCGHQATTQWLEWSREAEDHPPVHVPFDPWGRRVDQILMSPGWKNLENAAASEGIVASAYERKYGEYSRVYQAALLYLFHPSSAFVSCPLAMTDGAARAIELYGDETLKNQAFRHLTSRDPSMFWTSGQWMTERTGGSDVSGTATVARKNGQHWELHGIKWFTSATTSQMAMLLARPEGAPTGNRGLSLFYTELRNSSDQLNQIEIMRLKDKLGTRALPTAELHLLGTPAQLVGEEGNGVKKISALFNITRVYNSICAVSHFRRALDWAQSYSQVRTAFGKRLSDHPLHRLTLQNLEASFEKSLLLTFEIARLLGKDECGSATETEKTLLRALTPIVKLYTAKRCMEGTSEAVEIFAGAGYCEDTRIPILLRDAQVFSIWEGTTNVLALDFLRTLEKENSGPVILEFLEKNKDAILATSNPECALSMERAYRFLKNISQLSKEEMELNSRKLCFDLAEIFAAALCRRSTSKDLC